MMLGSFPLKKAPVVDWTGSRGFGANRDNGHRKHAGCDLIVPEGTEILSVAHGLVVRGPYLFYLGTFAIEVDHGAFIARYCEIGKIPDGVKEGVFVDQGQVIAYVGRLNTSSMLHLEMYNGFEHGPLTQRDNPPFQRRADLIDPTPYLNEWKAAMPME